MNQMRLRSHCTATIYIFRLRCGLYEHHAINERTIHVHAWTVMMKHGFCGSKGTVICMYVCMHACMYAFTFLDIINKLLYLCRYKQSEPHSPEGLYCHLQYSGHFNYVYGDVSYELYTKRAIHSRHAHGYGHRFIALHTNIKR
jgi:hypothetical protein